MERYCLYLRKSRADCEAEARGETETLARHEKILMELAEKLHLHITAVYREIVSGETISARPVMQQLLSEVEKTYGMGGFFLGGGGVLPAVIPLIRASFPEHFSTQAPKLSLLPRPMIQITNSMRNILSSVSLCPDENIRPLNGVCTQEDFHL